MAARLYCYVDESGQDSTAHDARKRIFVVAVAIFEADRELLCTILDNYEAQSGKGRRKWNSTNVESRLTYWQLISADDKFKRVLYFSQEEPPYRPEFDARTIISIAKALRMRQPDGDYSADIYVDGISETKQTHYANELRSIGVKVHRVRRAKKNENGALIRLADALAGLAREAAEGNTDAQLLLVRAGKRGNIAEL